MTDIEVDKVLSDIRRNYAEIEKANAETRRQLAETRYTDKRALARGHDHGGGHWRNGGAD